MSPRGILLIGILAATLCAQSTTTDEQKKQPAGLYQGSPRSHLHKQKDDFFHASTKLLNPHDVDYGALLEQRRQAFLDASAANPFFWYSALTTALLMAMIVAYGVRAIDEKRRLWHAAEILTDVWNDSELARAHARAAIDKHNQHVRECNRVAESQASGRSSPAALEAEDARAELMRLRGDLDNVDSERKMLKAKLEEKEKIVDNLSRRLGALEKSGPPAFPSLKELGNGNFDSESKLVARINQLTQQLESERQKNRALKGA